MRTLACPLLLLAFAGPALAQGRERRMDPDRLREIIEEATAAESRSKLDRTGDAETKGDQRVAKEVRRMLATRRVTVSFDQTPLTEGLDFLRDVTGLNIVISKRALERAGEKKLTLRLKDIKLKNCLELMLQLADGELRYGVRHGVLTIGLSDEWRSAMRVELYFVADLLDGIPDFPAPRLGLEGVTWDE
jgi:type II secretory pathway component HofQ